MVRVLTATCAVAVLAGCATSGSPEYFRPTERVLATSESGAPAAAYDIQTTAGRYGEAQVWAPAAYEVDGATYVLVGITVENTSNQPLTVDLAGTWLEDVRTDDATYNRIAAETYEGEPTVPPGEVRDVRFYFAMPRRVSPQEVDAFRVRWSVQTDRQRAFRQFTPFTEDEAYSYAYSPYPVDAYGYGYGFVSPYYGLGYDPFVYDPFFGPYVYHWAPPVRVHPRVVIRDHRRRVR